MNSAYRTYRNLIAIMIVVLILSLMVGATAGCTTYHVKLIRPGVDGYTLEWDSKSNRAIEEPRLQVERNGPNDFKVNFNAEAMTPTASPIEDGIADGIRAGSDTLAPIP
jgi:hypothetical protein